jgi:hypothetical protein
MGTWAPDVQHHDSNWRELRTLLWTLERLYAHDPTGYIGATLFYFTDNLVSYYVVQNGSSSSPELHNLVRQVKVLEMKMGCRLEVIHVPGRLMIGEGTDGLSRGIWISPDRMLRSTVEESRMTLEAIPLTPALGRWILNLVGLSKNTKYTHHTSMSSWDWDGIFQKLSIWNPSPEIARQALSHFLDCWVERAHETAGIFIIPRILQREWGHLSKHVLEIAVIYPHTLPDDCRFDSLIPFCVLFIPPYRRTLPITKRLEHAPATSKHARWHEAQAEQVRRVR